MEILLLNLLLKSGKNDYSISNSRLLLELCMINPNYLKFFSKRNELAEILELKIEHIIDHLDTTNSTFKTAINSAIKRLESRKLIIHERVMIVKVLETEVQVTPNGYARVNDIYYYDEENNKYIHKNVRPKETIRQATQEEKEMIINIEKEVMEKEFKCYNLQQIYSNGYAYNYYRIVQERLFNELNIKNHYKAHFFTMNNETIRKASIKYLDTIEEIEKQKQLNMKIISRLGDNAIRRHNKAMVIEEAKKSKREIIRSDDNYIENLKLLNHILIDIKNYKPLKKATKEQSIIEIDEYILDNLPEGL